jgi:hypothetical protein
MSARETAPDKTGLKRGKKDGRELVELFCRFSREYWSWRAEREIGGFSLVHLQWDLIDVERSYKRPLYGVSSQRHV